MQEGLCDEDQTKRDGTMVEVSDNYVLQDGESFTRPLMMMDSRTHDHRQPWP